MREGSAPSLGPFDPVVQALQHSLVMRAEYLLIWVKAPEGLIAEIPEGKLLLTRCAAFWMLTVIFEGDAPPNEDGSPRGKVELGRRRIAVGSVSRIQRVAMALLHDGVPGGPSDTDRPDWAWIHGSLRMMFPAGELRLSEAADGPCMLTFEDGAGVELLARGPRDEMERQAILRWELRVARPLRLVVTGQVVHLRSIDVEGVLGYHALTDNRRVALVRAGNELALVFMEGLYASLLARVSWEAALNGEPFDVDALMERRTPANHGPSANEAPGSRDARQPSPEPSAITSRPSDVADDVAPATASAGARPNCPPGCTPMSEYNRALCRWYLEWLHGRLRGRGARKARALVLRILDALDWCRVDITGTRAEVHAALVRILGSPTLLGEDRNIRDALDLLASQSLLVHRSGMRCTLVLSQFHDLDSVLMRWIAAEKNAAEGGVAKPMDERTAVTDPPETETASPLASPVAEAPTSSETMPTTPKTAEVPPQVAETSLITESAPERPTPTPHGVSRSSGLEAVAAFLAMPPASALLNVTAMPPSSAPMNLNIALPSSAPTSLTSVPSSGESSVAGLEPTLGDGTTSATAPQTSAVMLDSMESVAPMDEPRTCPITWSAFASCESSHAEVLPSMPEPSAGSPPDVSLSGFTRARFPVTDE